MLSMLTRLQICLSVLLVGLCVVLSVQLRVLLYNERVPDKDNSHRDCYLAAHPFLDLLQQSVTTYWQLNDLNSHDNHMLISILIFEGLA